MQPELDQFLADRIDEITAEVTGEIAARVPVYAHLRATEILNVVRDALAVYAGACEASAVLPVFRALGAGEACAGQDVRHLESALRTGARVLVRRTASAAARLYPPTAEYITVMETAFIAEGELVGAAVDGHRRAMRPAVASRLSSLLSGN
ncbi:hypothetical protein E1293_29445 [Actinomadura darangshiensis]|uniref:PucR-like N-terminal domain-containing protein n=1 Tax=Actinomadura darangshiensis TaxID=705336 RepID=A0A4R5APH3_9ACTN|nr:hypothetical protein [Actinomadura darangshiensis]TDD74533.1 hypothetical protein E1293_29445 [Actinomadura darangshiensis]